MSQLVAPARAPSRAVAMLALAGLGCWAVLTALIGAVSVVTCVVSLHQMQSGPVAPDGSDPLVLNSQLLASVTLFVGWLLSLNAVLVAAVLGVVEIAVRQRSWLRCVAFAVVAVAGPVGAFVVSQLGNGVGDPFDTSYLEVMAPGLALIAIALVTMVAARLLLRPRPDTAVAP